MAELGSILGGTQAIVPQTVSGPLPGAAGNALEGTEPGSMPGVGPPVDEEDMVRRHASWSEFLARPEIIGGLLSFSEAIIQPGASFPGALNQAIRTAGAAIGAQRELQLGEVEAGREARGFETQEQLRQAQIAQSQVGIQATQAGIQEGAVGADLKRAQLEAAQAELPYVGRIQEAELARLEAETARAGRPDQGPAPAAEIQLIEYLKGLGIPPERAMDMLHGSKKGEIKDPGEKFMADTIGRTYSEAAALGTKLPDAERLYNDVHRLKTLIYGEAAPESGTTTDPVTGSVSNRTKKIAPSLDKAKLASWLQSHGIRVEVRVKPLENGSFEVYDEKNGTLLRTVSGASLR